MPRNHFTYQKNGLTFTDETVAMNYAYTGNHQNGAQPVWYF
ncbi:hypothetical protein QNI16_23285 [Cytophagaceae bacterium YF14B1]|uniref:Uncharacterized protein n=1 Tax=Xanthocytophaga flava TaxID=3048013 RepID=A0AAE3QVQ7_9BACT|nr:hypothetical protein [Xanthocytophaga flavus]MDJ1483443.1 hypothetical protein [Xanthocytophaga flavus]